MDADVLDTALSRAAEGLPGCFLAVASSDDILYSSRQGRFDVLGGCGRRQVDDQTIVWLSSATRFIIAIAYLQLVDRKVIALDTPLKSISTEFHEATRSVLTGFGRQSGEPIFEPAERDITLEMMLNGTSGFSEFSGDLRRWKEWAAKTRPVGHVNSCKKDDLIRLPPVSQPGVKYAYDFAADWLAYLFPLIAGQSQGPDLETYLQEHVFEPLGMEDTTYFPFDTPDRAARVMPLRVLGKDSVGRDEWQVFDRQMDVHKMPRSKDDIEYPNASGLYTKPSSFIKLLQNVLNGTRWALGLTQRAPAHPLFSKKCYRLMADPAVSASKTADLASLMNGYFHLRAEEGEPMLTAADVSVSMGNVPMYVGDCRKAHWGRESGSFGWGGAGGTDFWIDPKSDIAVYFTTQMLPGSCDKVKQTKKDVERAVYQALAGAR